jgi:hypothetical protein
MPGRIAAVRPAPPLASGQVPPANDKVCPVLEEAGRRSGTWRLLIDNCAGEEAIVARHLLLSLRSGFIITSDHT